MKQGHFITLEGIEGAGKSTCSQIVLDCLSQQGISAMLTREPGGTPLGEKIREILLTPIEPFSGGSPMVIEAELLLLFAARIQHMQTCIKPALMAGSWVVCDRFIDASYAYQGGGRGLKDERIQALETWVQLPFKPDLTLLLDLPVEMALQRIRQRHACLDRFEQESSDFFKRIRDKYLERAQLEPNRIKIIDASQALDSVKMSIFEAMKILIQSTVLLS